MLNLLILRNDDSINYTLINSPDKIFMILVTGDAVMLSTSLRGKYNLIGFDE